MVINKDNIKTFLVLLIVVLGIGYAYINSDLNINGTAQVNHANWDVHWANIQVKNGSVSASSPTISNQTTVNYSVTLNQPGDYYEFTLDAVNGGIMDAMIDTISSKLNGATITTLPDYLSYTVTYEDGVELEQNHLLAANSMETYKVNIKYRDNIEANQLPASNQTLSLQFTVTYRQANDDAVDRPIPGVLPNYDESGGCATINTDSSGGGGNATMSGLTLMMKNATQGEDDPSWFTDTAENQSQAGVYTRKGTSNDRYPIYYYRGAYASVNNNLIFNNYCWKIVRTTATGGIRIIYNGPASNGECTTQTGATTYIQTAAFNTSSNEAKYVKYVYDNNGTPTDSNLKTVLDNWYNTNMSSVDNKIETSIYCNDTSEMSTEEKSALGIIGITSYTYYCPLKRANNGTPTTLCSKKSDAYKLKVGFLTVDEEALAGRSFGSGMGMQDYLYNNSSSWLGSPRDFGDSTAYVFLVYCANNLNDHNNVNGTRGVRPVVSLVPNISYSGPRTTTNPFVVN